MGGYSEDGRTRSKDYNVVQFLPIAWLGVNVR